MLKISTVNTCGSIFQLTTLPFQRYGFKALSFAIKFSNPRLILRKKTTNPAFLKIIQKLRIFSKNSEVSLFSQKFPSLDFFTKIAKMQVGNRQVLLFFLQICNCQKSPDFRYNCKSLAFCKILAKKISPFSPSIESPEVQLF